MLRKSMIASVAAVVALAGYVLADADRAYLGILGENPPAGSKDNGALVKEVVKDGPADKAGIKAGDRIIQVDDQEIKSFDDMQVRMGGFKAGQKVEMKVVRDGKEESLSVQLGKRPADEPKAKREPAADAHKGRVLPGGRFQFRIPFGGGLPNDIQKQIEEAMKGALGEGREAAPHQPMIGVQLQPIDDALAKKLGLGDAKGVLVMGVTPDGPAAKAGVQSEDVILEADGKTVADPEALKEVVASKKEHDKIQLKLRRGNETLEKSVEVAMSPAGAPAGVFFREFSSPEQFDEKFADIRERMEQMREKVEKMTKEHLEGLQKKFEDGQAESKKALDAAQEKIKQLEEKIGALSKRIEEMASEKSK